MRRENLFRFEELWLQSEDECKEVVAEAWSGIGSDLTIKKIEVGGRPRSW